MNSFLLTLALCALSLTANAAMIPEEDSVHIIYLPNGIKTYIQEHQSPPRCASFRVVLRNSSLERAQYSMDATVDSPEKIRDFFAYCRQKASPSGRALKDRRFSYSDVPSFDSNPQEIAIVAVGDFSAEEMRQLIEQHFGDVVLSPQSRLPLIQTSCDPGISKVGLSVSYPHSRQSILTMEDLKRVWEALLLQELFQQRMERSSKSLQEDWVHPYPQFFYPVNGYAMSSIEASENLLSFLFWQIEAMLNEGFFEDEFSLVKHKLVNQLQYLAFNASAPDVAFLASYYVDQFLLCDRCLQYQSFLHASANIIQEIDSQDLTSHLASFFLEDNRQIKMVYPALAKAEMLTPEQVEKLIDRVIALGSFYRNSQTSGDAVWEIESANRLFQALEDTPIQLMSLHEGVSEPQAVLPSFEPFYQLPLSEKEMRFIKIIITTMAEKNVLQLAFEKHSLEKKGKKIHHVHPLRFMGYILSHPQLKHCLKSIKKSSFKWDAFIDGFAKRMKEELSRGNVYQHVPGFAQLVGSTPEHVNHYIEKKDFVGLVKSLM